MTRKGEQHPGLVGTREDEKRHKGLNVGENRVGGRMWVGWLDVRFACKCCAAAEAARLSTGERGIAMRR